MKKILSFGIIALLLSICILFYAGFIDFLINGVKGYGHNSYMERIGNANRFETDVVSRIQPESEKGFVTDSTEKYRTDIYIVDINEDKRVYREKVNNDEEIINQDNSNNEDSKDDDKVIDTEEEKVKPEMFATEIPILVYHHILKDNENPYKDNTAIISLKRFTDHIDYLYRNGYRTITLDQLSRFLDGEQELPEKSIMITFDDGYKSNYIYGYAVLKEYGFNAVAFLITDCLTDETIEFDPSKLQYLSWEEVNSSKDVFQFASHTHNMHRDPNGVGHLISKPIDEVKNDLVTSKNLLDTNAIAYPFGQYNDEVLSLLKDLEFDLGFTVNEGKVKECDNRLLLKRIGIFSYTTLSKFKRLIR